MSRGDLQEMEVKTQQSKTAVNAGAAAADPMPKLTTGGTHLVTSKISVVLLQRTTRPTMIQLKLKTPGGTLKQVKDVVNKGAGKADPMPAGMKEEEESHRRSSCRSRRDTEEEVVAEAETTEEEVVSEEEVTETEEIVAEYDIEEDVNALLAGEELSEEFQEKARTIFEAAINAKVAGIREELEAKYEEKFVEEVASAKESLAERVDSYLEYVADEWMSENQLAVEVWP